MKKIKVKEKWILELDKYAEEKDESFSMLDLEIDIVNYQYCNMSGFKRILHIITDINNDIQNKDIIHEKISNNDFTVLMFLDVLEII